MSKIGDMWDNQSSEDFASQILDPTSGTIRFMHNDGHQAGKEGDGNKKGAGPGTGAADTLAAISLRMFEESDPLRVGLIGRSEDFLNGGLDVTQSPMYGALKAGNDSAFQRARNNTISSTAAGGGLTDALTNLETSRAVEMSRGVGQLGEGELGRALTLATGQTPTAVGGLGQAAGIQAQQMAAQQAQQSQQKQGAGTAVGSILAAFMG